MGLFCGEIYAVPHAHLVLALGDKHLLVSDDRHDGDMEIRKQLGKLGHRRINHRAVLLQPEPDNTNLVFGKWNQFENPRHLQAAVDGLGDFPFRGNNIIDRHFLDPEQIGPGGLEIGTVADPGNLDRHLKEGFGHLTGDHIDLIRIGNRDQHVGVRGVGMIQEIRVGGITNQGLDVELFTDFLDQFRRPVDDGNVIVLFGQILGNAVPNLASAANDHFHEKLSRPCLDLYLGSAAIFINPFLNLYPAVNRQPEKLQLPVQG